MANLKRHFIAGRMNKSVDERLVPNGEYIDAMNVRLGSTEASEIGSVENSKGNTQISSLQYNNTALSPSAKCIGAYEDGARETIYWFVHDPAFTGAGAGATGKLDMIVSMNVNTETITYHVISVKNGSTTNTTLNFNPAYLINGVNMAGQDLLIFTDNINPPRIINVRKNYQDPTGAPLVDQFTEEEILVIKKPPVTAPIIKTNTIPGNDDFIEERFLCFAYRYRYADNQYSAISQFSKPAFEPDFFNVTIATFLNEGMQNADNNVIITMDTGGPLVVGFDLLYKESTNSVVRVVQKFDKNTDGISDNTNFIYQLSGYKVFTVLPDSEILRTYDNVPLLANTQTLMGNRLVYGNYVEGYDLKDKNGNNINLNFNTSLITEEVSTLDIPTTLGNPGYSADPANSPYLVLNGLMQMNFNGIELKRGSTISIDFTLDHADFTSNTVPALVEEQQPIEITWEYTLIQDYLTDGTSTGAYKLATSADFLNSLGTSPPTGTMLPVYDATNPTSCNGFTLTDVINCAIQNTLDAGTPQARTKYESGYDDIPANGNQGIAYVLALVPPAVTSDVINIQLPAMRRVDDVVTPTASTYEYFQIVNPLNRFSSVKSPLSLHSNRNYEVGIIYMDEYNRATTALVSTNNSVQVPCSNSIFRNFIQLNIPPSQIAPSFATRYKLCIKPDKKGYDTIYSNFYVQDTSTGDTYILLEGQNTRKVEEGDTLNVKRDSVGPITSCTEVVVLEKKPQQQNFLDPAPTDDAGDPIPLPSGTYIKLATNSISLDLPDNALVNPGQETVFNNFNNKDQPLMAYGELGDFTIPERARIVLKFKFERLGTGDGNNNCERRIYEYERTFFADADYDDIVLWFEGQGIQGTLADGETTTGNGSSITNTYLAPTSTTANDYQMPTDSFTNYYRWYKNGTDIRFIMTGPPRCGNGNSEKKRSSITCEWQIFRSENLLVFETQPEDATPDLWYEGSESYAIDQATGFHSGSPAIVGGQDQTAVDDAIVKTTFGNCYSFGNGVESFKILDSIVGKPMELGERFFSTSAEDYSRVHRFADLTYSGVFNDETNVNKLNEFNLGLLNFKTLEDSFGPVYLIDGRETDILTLQEDKISYVLAGKNLLSDSTGGGSIASVPEVLGTQIARVEKYGISQNPESYVKWGFYKFFTDAKRGALIQLKGSGQAEQLTVISELGMRSWFRDLFIGSSDTQKLGAFDPYMNEYVLSSNEIKIPQEEPAQNCGVKRTITVTQADPLSFTVNLGETTGVCTISYDIISIASDAGATGGITIAEDYQGTSTFINTLGAGTITFDKNSVGDDDVVVTLTPSSGAGKQTVVLEITVGCPAAQQITLTTFCVSDAADAGKFIHNQYQWTDGSFISALQSERVQFSPGKPAISAPIVSSTTVVTALQGGGIIPNNGDVLSVISNAIPPSDDYKFQPSNRMLFCRSTTLYPPTFLGYNSLLTDPGLQVLPQTGAIPTITGTYTIPAGGTEEYMYIVFDYFS